MSPGRRFARIGLLVAAAEAALGALVLGSGVDGYLFGCAGASAALALAGRRLLDRPGGGPPPPPPGGPPDPEPPPWWPEFEAAFARHVRERDRAGV